MDMAAPIVMPTDTADLLKLSQWLSPAFPISAYAYSHGLEAEIASGRVTDAAALEAWLKTLLRSGAPRSDAILILAARKDGADLDDLSDFARALAGSKERLEETEAQGAALAETLGGLGQGDGVSRPYPVALGQAARGLAVDDDTLVSLFFQSVMGNLVSAAVRFMPLGQAEGQGVLSRLHPELFATVDAVLAASLDDIGQAVFGADLAAMEHETQEVRIFRT